MTDLKAGSIEDWIVTAWYTLSVIGLVAGAQEHGIHLMDGLEFGTMVGCDYCATATQINAAFLWGNMLLIGAVLLFFELCYHLRLLHGGADAKAMMFIALCLPHWDALPAEETALMPPALALLVWGSMVFLALPLYVFFCNLKAGDASNLKMAWHARKTSIEDLAGRHVWILDEVVEDPDGSKRVVTRMRPRRGGRSEDDVEGLVSELEGLGVNKVWVTEKYPFMVFLMIGIVPLIAIGDPILFLLTNLGIL